MQTQRCVLRPIPGVSREIGYMLAGLEEIRGQTIALIRNLSREELSARVLPEFNQIGALALHLGECEFWWIQANVAKKELTEADMKLAHIGDTTEADFSLKGYDAEKCIEILSAIHQRSIETLAAFSDDDLDTIISFEPHPVEPNGSLRWILHRLIDHEAGHKGQIAMIKRLMREG